jgi:hypothetical protein
MAAKGPKGINWEAERDLYATGDESLRAVARRLGVAEATVTKVACDPDHLSNYGRKWSEWRASFREGVGEKTREKAAEIQAAQAASVNARQRSAIESLVEAAVPKALEALQSDDLEPKERVKLALAAMAMQRRIHGLDRAAALEVTGKDGEPIDVEVRIDPVTDAAARTLLEAALGRSTQPG